MNVYETVPCTRLAHDPASGVRLMSAGELLATLSPAEARGLGADLIIAANASENQWDAPGPRARETAGEAA